jgi:hypothetical protein
MTVAASGRRRGLWPVLLISTALVGLTLGAVAVGQLYWSSMHDSMRRMRDSIAETRIRHQALLSELQAARAALAAQRAQAATESLQSADDSRAAASADDAAPPALVAPPLPRMPDTGPGPLLAILESLRHEAARLGPGARGRAVPERWPARRASRTPAAPGQLLKDQLRLAELAVARGDALLLDHAAGAAQRLLLEFYGDGDPRAALLLQRLDGLRAALRRHTAPAR